MNRKWLILGTVPFSVGLSLSLIINRDIKYAALTGLLSVPATVAGVSITEHQRRKKLNDKISTQQRQLRDLVQQETDFNNSITLLSRRVESLRLQEEDIKTAISSLSANQQQSQSALDTLQNNIRELSDRKSKLEPEITALETNLRQLREQETVLNELSDSQKELQKEIFNLSEQKQTLAEQLNERQHSLNQLRQQRSDLEKAISTKSDEKELARQLHRRKQQLIAENNSLQNDNESLSQKQAKIEAEKQQEINKLIEQQQKGDLLQKQIVEREDRLSQLDKELKKFIAQEAELQNNKSQLNQEIKQLQDREDKLNRLVINFNREEEIEFDVVDRESGKSTTKAIVHQTEETVSLPIDLDNSDYNFSNAEHIKCLWENIILPNWNHKERPFGYRFLGNIDLDSEVSDCLIEIVGENLRRLEYITDIALEQSFSALDKDWIKIITFSLSEYAYYDSDRKFWEGFCDRVNIEHSQTVENTLRQITEQGIDSLGLIRALGGYKYVSTLWLQSGVPKQNMGHFAAIVEDLADEYGWWEISHSSVEDIAETLWRCWQNRYSQWGTIRHFLSLDNSSEDIEPISGQLVKNIAIIARELEHRGLDPETIKDRESREELIGDSNLSYSFFIRDWSDLITVLTPHTGKSDRSISKRRNKPPYLYLDIADTLNTLLILPEQSIWRNQWQNLRGTYCQIPEAVWEDDIPSQGNLEISELEIDIKQATNKWTFQLQNHHRNEIYRWEHQGINSEFSCLIFNAFSGEHIRVDLAETNIVGVESIILFTPREVQIELDNNFKIIDDFVPSSIKGWRGKEIKLIASKASIKIQNVVINWQLQEKEQPRLVGLRTKSKKPTFINPPTFYYPPQEQNITLNYKIERVNERSIIASDRLITYDPTIWTSIDLRQWIGEAGNYYATFWHEEKQWSYSFEVRQKYRVTQHQGYRNLEVRDRANNLLSIPVKYNTLNKFWAAEIVVDNLYPLEEVSIQLSGDDERYIFQDWADSQGKLMLSLATLYNCLSQCDCEASRRHRYSLDVKQLGLQWQRILQVGYLVRWQITAKRIAFMELLAADNYYLTGWNLLNPERESEIINFSYSDLEQLEVELYFSPGIYLIQLYRQEQLIENIGLWCNIELQNMPEEILNNDTLSNYCYSILDNESLSEFSNALKQLNVDFNLDRIQITLNSLHKEKCYLPAWLDRNSLTEKIQNILEVLITANNPVQKLAMGKENRTHIASTNAVPGQWCMVTVRQRRRDSFLICLNSDIEKQQLQELFLEITVPEEAVYRERVLIRTSNFIEARRILQQINNFQNVQRLTSDEVSRMLNQ